MVFLPENKIIFIMSQWCNSKTLNLNQVRGGGISPHQHPDSLYSFILLPSPHFALLKLAEKYERNGLEILSKLAHYGTKAVSLVYIYALFMGLCLHLPHMAQNSTKKLQELRLKYIIEARIVYRSLITGVHRA